MRTAKIRRNQHFRNGCIADPGIGQLVGDELSQFLAHVLRDALIAMCGHNCTIAKVKLIPGLLLAGLLLAAAARAQPVSVYSEFARINAAGDVTAPEAPREILSPAVVRNGFTSFQVVVQAPADKTWWLFVGQNPDNTFKLTMYKESGDSLEPVELPRMSSGTEVLWLDVWTEASTRVERVKLEPELNINDDW